jgi:hypothetical protein
VKLRHSACFLAAASLLAAARMALAGGTPPIVRVYVAGPPEAVTGSRDAVQDLCSRSNVAVVVRDAAGADEALLATKPAPGLAEAYVDLRPGSPTRVVVIDGETRQDLERRTLPEGSSLEISIETVARVVCSAVESSLAARAAATNARVVAPLSPAHVMDRPSAWDARAGLFAATENLGAGFQGGGGGALSLSAGRSRVKPAIFASFAGYASADVKAVDSDARASFGLIGLRLLPMLEWRASGDVTAFFGLGGGGDWIQVTAVQAPPDGAIGAARTTLEAIASGMLGARVRLTRSLSALFALDADVDLTRHRYVTTSPADATFFEPSRVRPMGLAGLSLSFGNSVVEPSLQRQEDRR